MKIAALVSGGVDSSVALRLLQQEGHDITAYYLKVWLEDELDFLGECPWEEDVEFVEQVCAQANVPLHILPLQQAYRERIVSYTIDEIRKGRTPNPDVMCNNRIKFGVFYENVGDTADLVATGHYADRVEKDGAWHLKITPDPIKDQTYFLSHLTQEQLSRATFPIGAYKKSRVRELAEEFQLPNMHRKDSQGLCFLGKISFRDFIKHHMGEKPGDFREAETGERIGTHRGFWFYTIGQRKGLGLSGGPWFVTGKDVNENIIYISRSYDDPAKKRDAFLVEDAHWIAGTPPAAENLRVKVRHGEEYYECSLTPAGGDGKWRVKLDGRDQGIAPGQFAVFYQGDLCLGCAVISAEQE